MTLAPTTSRSDFGTGITGALPTVQLVSGAGAVFSTSRTVAVYTPVTLNPTGAATATCTVAVAPDGATFSTLSVVTLPIGVTFDGTIHMLTVVLPQGWTLRMTVVNATLGVSTWL